MVGVCSLAVACPKSTGAARAFRVSTETARLNIVFTSLRSDGSTCRPDHDLPGLYNKLSAAFIKSHGTQRIRFKPRLCVSWMHLWDMIDSLSLLPAVRSSDMTSKTLCWTMSALVLFSSRAALCQTHPA